MATSAKGPEGPSVSAGWSQPQRLRRAGVGVVVAALALLGMQALAFRTGGGSALITAAFWISELGLALLGLLTAVGLLLAPVLLGQGLLARRRGDPAGLIPLGLLLLLPGLLWTAIDQVGLRVRRQAAAVAAAGWQPVADALVAYEQDHETHPENLYALKSRGYLKDWPTSRLAIPPMVSYEDDPEPRLGQWPRWELSVSLPGLTHTDELFYWPEKDYPREVRGRSLHRIGDWLLVQG